MRSSRATEDGLFSGLWEEEKGRIGTDDPQILRKTRKATLVETLIRCEADRKGDAIVDKIVSEIRSSGGSYYKRFDYDGLGSNFFKTSVRTSPADGKYLLQICAAYVGSQPEKELAESLGKQRALTAIGSKFTLTPLASGWAAVDIEQAFRDTGLTARQRKAVAMFASRDDTSYGQLVFSVAGMPVDLSAGIRQEGVHSPHHVIRAKGISLYLAANEGGGNFFFAFSLSPAERYKPIVSEEKRAQLTSRRDDLMNAIRENLS